MSNFILNLNNILQQWKQQYDLFSAISYDFTLEENEIRFANCVLCTAEPDIEVERSMFDAEGIRYFLTGNRCIVIAVAWPEDEPPAITSVGFIHLLYDE